MKDYFCYRSTENFEDIAQIIAPCPSGLSDKF